MSSLLGGKLPLHLIKSIVALLDKKDTASLAAVNRDWYHEVKGRICLIRCQDDSYFIKFDISREEKEKILNQTGFDIPFIAGKNKMQDYVIGKGAFGEFRIAYACKKAHYFGIKITTGGDEIEKEAEMQKSIGHLPYIMSLVDFCKLTNNLGEVTLLQVMELAGLGRFSKIAPLIKDLDSSFKEQLLFCMMKGFFLGIHGLHGEVMHTVFWHNLMLKKISGTSVRNSKKCLFFRRFSLCYLFKQSRWNLEGIRSGK